jgi:hypothetical protein
MCEPREHPCATSHTHSLTHLVSVAWLRWPLAAWHRAGTRHPSSLQQGSVVARVAGTYRNREHKRVSQRSEPPTDSSKYLRTKGSSRTLTRPTFSAPDPAGAGQHTQPALAPFSQRAARHARTRCSEAPVHGAWPGQENLDSQQHPTTAVPRILAKQSTRHGRRQASGSGGNSSSSG